MVWISLRGNKYFLDFALFGNCGWARHWFKLFIKQFVQANIKENIDVPHYWPFVWGNHWSLVDFPHQGPATECGKRFYSMTSSWRDLHPNGHQEILWINVNTVLWCSLLIQTDRSSGVWWLWYEEMYRFIIFLLWFYVCLKSVITITCLWMYVSS